MTSYDLNFISDEDLITHVTETVNKYSHGVNSWSQLTRNTLDPIKLTFDTILLHGGSIEASLLRESLRQSDKTNGNLIGYFHQGIFKYLGNGWRVPKAGYDIENTEMKIYVEMKNKHNTMNNGAATSVYRKMLNTVLTDPEATCLLVEVISKKSQDVQWGHPRIRRVSIDRFYELVTGNSMAFSELCAILPQVISDTSSKLSRDRVSTILSEIKALSKDLLKVVYKKSFATYIGFK